MAAELRKEFPKATVELIPSSGGRFEVIVDDEPMFQKSKAKRHAESGEIVRLIRGR